MTSSNQKYRFDRRDTHYYGPVKRPKEGYVYREANFVERTVPFLMTVTAFLAITVVAVAVFIFAVGYVRYVWVDGVSPRVYVENTLYDMLHWNKPESMSRLKMLIYQITHWV
ncbi:MAG: hypothetical protein NC930_01965 [Candidatus Omnitrophica bacterium]|nr:hypothetical protein [Candidatus Omnitrophota bacterium]